MLHKNKSSPVILQGRQNACTIFVFLWYTEEKCCILLAVKSSAYSRIVCEK